MAAVPTKGNLIAAKKSLDLSSLGFELLDRKRNILVREMMSMIDAAAALQGRIDSTYADAYAALQRANTTLGMCDAIAESVPVDNGLHISSRSVMGVELPTVTLDEQPVTLRFGLSMSNSMLDEAYIKFLEVKRMTARLAEVENSVYRLAAAIKKTQKRANALKNILIPRFEEEIKFISDALEEKEREEFTRLKVIKRNKESGAQ
ncbi:MAG: V-type ATP synthase subunit D [Clostridia bacterium]|nr:V-type ATP synthase subunit D [Clostridia bacterium]